MFFGGAGYKSRTGGGGLCFCQPLGRAAEHCWDAWARSLSADRAALLSESALRGSGCVSDWFVFIYSDYHLSQCLCTQQHLILLVKASSSLNFICSGFVCCVYFGYHTESRAITMHPLLNASGP